jgi:hypothetical protein
VGEENERKARRRMRGIISNQINFSWEIEHRTSFAFFPNHFSPSLNNNNNTQPALDE